MSHWKQILVGVAIAVLSGLSLWAAQSAAAVNRQIAVHDTMLTQNDQDHADIKLTLNRIDDTCQKILLMEASRRGTERR